MNIAIEALKRIALNISGDTVPQVIAGEALDKIKAAAPSVANGAALDDLAIECGADGMVSCMTHPAGPRTAVKFSVGDGSLERFAAAIAASAPNAALVVNTEWISVDDELPEIETDVLVCGDRGDSICHTVAGLFCGVWQGQDNEQELRFTVSHWMPLPTGPNAPPHQATQPASVETKLCADFNCLLHAEPGKDYCCNCEPASVEAQLETVANVCGTEYVMVRRDAIDWLKKYNHALCVKSGLCENIGGRLYTRTIGGQNAISTTPLPQPDIERDAARYRWILENYAFGDGYNKIDAALNDGDADKHLSPAIDAAMAAQQSEKGGA